MAYVAKITAGGNSNMLVGSSLYGTCTTAVGTAQKDVTMSGFDTLITGVTIHVKFTNSNTASSATLKVGSTAAKPIKMYGTTAVGTSVPLSWPAGAVVSFTYDNTNWIMNDFSGYNLDASRLTAGTVPAARLPFQIERFSQTWTAKADYNNVLHTCTKTITSFALAFAILDDNSDEGKEGLLNATTMVSSTRTLGLGFGGGIPANFGVTVSSFPILRVNANGRVGTTFNNEIPTSGRIEGVVIYQ